jgi:hypothetical protein
MKYLYTSNATKEYKALGDFWKFESIHTLHGWVGAIKVNAELAEELLKHPQVQEVDEDFYNNLVKKKNLTQNPNRKEIQVTLDATKPMHAQEKSAESVEVEEIEVRDIDPPKKSSPKKASRKKK